MELLLWLGLEVDQVAEAGVKGQVQLVQKRHLSLRAMFEL